MDYLSQIKTILVSELKDQKCKIYLFGSRTTDTYTAASDFDIAILATGDINRELSLTRERLELSNIPFKVDLINLRTTSAAFRHKVQTKGILLWKN